MYLNLCAGEDTSDLFLAVNTALGIAADGCTAHLKEGSAYCVGPMEDWKAPYVVVLRSTLSVTMTFTMAHFQISPPLQPRHHLPNQRRHLLLPLPLQINRPQQLCQSALTGSAVLRLQRGPHAQVARLDSAVVSKVTVVLRPLFARLAIFASLDSEPAA